MTPSRTATDRRINELRAALDASRAEVRALRASTSWRITAPLRAVVNLLRGSPPPPAPAAVTDRPLPSLPHVPEFHGQFRNQAEWGGWLRENPAVSEPGMGARLAAHALEHGLTIPLFGEVGPEGVTLANDEPREALLAMGLNSRLRAVLHILAERERAHDVSTTRIYAHEAITPFALAMRGRYARFLGSEYAADEAEARSLWPVPAIDIMRSGFPDAAFDFVLSNEVLEHVPDLSAALADTARILVPGGELIATFPFDWNAQVTSVRTRLHPDGTIEHLAPPEYHGNPVNPEGGSLVFQIPGWDILGLCRAAGFADASMVFIGSARLGICPRDIPGVFVLTARR
jgi:hypothetical protein